MSLTLTLTLALTAALPPPAIVVVERGAEAPQAAIDAFVEALGSRANIAAVVRAENVSASGCTDAWCRTQRLNAAAELIVITLVDGKLNGTVKRSTSADRGGELAFDATKPADAGTKLANALYPATASLSNIKGVRVPGASAGISAKGHGKVTAFPRKMEAVGVGELSKDEIQRTINKNIGGIQYCYEVQLKTTPGLAGRVVFEWTVGVDGAVTEAKAKESTIANEALMSCLLDKVKKLTFPAPRGGTVTIAYPFVFNAI